MPVITFKDVMNKTKCLLNGSVKVGYTLEQTLQAYACVIKEIEDNIDLSQVKLKDLDIINACKLKYKNLLTEVLNKLIASDKSINQSLSDLMSTINNFNTVAEVATDEKVKVSAADGEAGYLSAKITSPQPGTISTNNANQISFIGFLPIGSVVMIDAGRIADFDGTGKGKVGTDVWGYALSNGQNGTRNRFGKFPRFITAPSDAGNTGGNATVILLAANLPTVELPVNGTIADGLITPIQAEIKLEANKISDGSGGNTYLLRVGDGQTGANSIKTLPLNLVHSHTFDMKAKLDNPTPTAINLLPEFVYEIPIQRINV